MPTTIGQHTVATFTSPVNGTTPIDANTVRGNDNTIRASYNNHDGDPGIHVQSSTLASRPVAGTAGRKWITADAGSYKLWFDDGTRWHEIGNDAVDIAVVADETLAKGDVLSITGFNNGLNLPRVAKFTGASPAFAIAAEAIANGAQGYVINTGLINDINTNAFGAIGTVLYPAATGTFTATKPVSGTYQTAAYVLRQASSGGALYVEFGAPRIVERSDNTASTVVQRDASGNFSAGTITATLSGSITGNAATATALQTARNINGVSFNGTADITVTAAAGTLSGSTLASGVTASSLTSVGTLSSLTVSGNTYAATSSGNVGVGTSSVTAPGANITTVHIRGRTVNDGGGIRVDTSDASHIGLHYIGNAGYDIGTETNTPLRFYTGSGFNLRSTLTPTGNFGLGVVPSAWAANRICFQIGGSTSGHLAYNAPTGNLTANAYFDTTNSRYEYIGTGAATRYEQTAGVHAWYTAASGSADGAITFAQVMSLAASDRGTLGVGPSATSPATLGTNYATVDIRNTVGGGSFFGNPTDYAYLYADSIGATLATVTAKPFIILTNSVERARVTSTGNVVAGGSVALATTATDGFLYVPTCAGTPTGTPTAITGMAPIVVNTTNHKLYFYSGGTWRDAGP